ncbi:MAG: hypothetical protein VXY06_05430 [Bacteroidota bacterium]|nr:hypothetical protein [Bacteroidota bacterium]
MKNRILYFTFVMLILASCKKEELPNPNPNPTPQTESYNTIKSIVEVNCLGCHSSSQNSYIPDYTNYNNIKDYLDQPNNTFVDRLNSDVEFYKMPPSGNLSESDKNKLISWINDGYPE